MTPMECWARVMSDVIAVVRRVEVKKEPRRVHRLTDTFCGRCQRWVNVECVHLMAERKRRAG